MSNALDNRQVSPFKAWAVIDMKDKYVTTIHLSRADAIAVKASNRGIEDGKWKIVRVKVTPL
jgi:hypothetical protein